MRQYLQTVCSTKKKNTKQFVTIWTQHSQNSLDIRNTKLKNKKKRKDRMCCFFLYFKSFTYITIHYNWSSIILLLLLCFVQKKQAEQFSIRIFWCPSPYREIFMSHPTFELFPTKIHLLHVQSCNFFLYLYIHQFGAVKAQTNHIHLHKHKPRTIHTHTYSKWMRISLNHLLLPTPTHEKTNTQKQMGFDHLWRHSFIHK